MDRAPRGCNYAAQGGWGLRAGDQMAVRIVCCNDEPSACTSRARQAPIFCPARLSQNCADSDTGTDDLQTMCLRILGMVCLLQTAVNVACN